MTKLRKIETTLGIFFALTFCWSMFIATTHQAMVFCLAIIILLLFYILSEILGRVGKR